MTLPINAHLKLVHSQETQWVEVSEDLWKLVSANQDSIALSVTVPSLATRTPISTRDSQPSLDSFIARCRPATEGVEELIKQKMGSKVTVSAAGKSV